MTGVLERSPGRLRRALAQVGGEVAAVSCCALLAGCRAAGGVEDDGTAWIVVRGVLAPELRELLAHATFAPIGRCAWRWRGIPF